MILSLANLNLSKAVIIHVGINSSHGALGPLFRDGSFKYIPLPEGSPSVKSWTYSGLGCSKWLPVDWPYKYAHYDPEFMTCTWGDRTGIRTHWARKLVPGDFVFFLSSLQHKYGIRPSWSYCIIGYFQLDGLPKKISYPIPPRIARLYSNNAHFIRKGRRGESFILFEGGKNSRLLDRAVVLSQRSRPNDLALKLIPKPHPKNPRWWQSVVNPRGVRTLLEEIGQ